MKNEMTTQKERFFNEISKILSSEPINDDRYYFYPLNFLSTNKLIKFVVNNIFKNDNASSFTFGTFRTLFGGLSIEWSISDWEVSLESVPHHNTIEFHALNVLTDEEVFIEDVQDEKTLKEFNMFWKNRANLKNPALNKNKL